VRVAVISTQHCSAIAPWSDDDKHPDAFASFATAWHRQTQQYHSSTISGFQLLQSLEAKPLMKAKGCRIPRNVHFVTVRFASLFFLDVRERQFISTVEAPWQDQLNARRAAHVCRRNTQPS
jgi:hypothetical protein